MTTAANYIKVAHGAQISNPANLSPGEAKLVADFLIERKKAGQFRVLWSSFEETIDLLGNKEVYVINCWKPAVEALKSAARPFSGHTPRRVTINGATGATFLRKWPSAAPWTMSTRA